MAQPWTDAQIIALRAAIASGVMTVEYDGHRKTYQSLDAMRKALAAMLAENAAAATSSKGSFRLATTCKGV